MKPIKMKWFIRMFLLIWVLYAGYTIIEMSIFVFECLDVKDKETQDVVVTQERDEEDLAITGGG